MKKLLLTLVVSLSLLNCTNVDSGHTGAGVSWGGKTEMDRVYPEGMYWGLNWITDDMEQYDTRQKTMKEKYEFNDKNTMLTRVEVALDYSLDASKVNFIHSKIGRENMDIKIQKTLQSAAKEVIPQYSASELNLAKREEVERKITSVLRRELPEIYVTFGRVQLTDVDIPKPISDAAELAAKQDELNRVAGKKAVAAENNYKAAQWDAKTKEVLSQPAMLELKRLEIQEIWARKGVSPYGNNNVFGAESVSTLKGLR